MFLQKKGPVDIRVPPTDNGRLEAILEAHGISSSVMINNLQDLIDDEAKAMGKARAADNKQNHNMDWETYHPLEDFYGYFEYLTGKRNRHFFLLSKLLQAKNELHSAYCYQKLRFFRDLP